MELEPRDGETIGLPLVFPSRRFFTKMDAGRCEGSIEAALLAPALLASELWQVLPCLVGWCLPTADCLPENGRRRRFSAAPRAPWFHLRPTPRVRTQDIARQLLTAQVYQYSRTPYLSNE